MTTPNTTLWDTSLSVLAKHGRSFRFASIFLSPEMRRDAAITYAFCRTVDDAVDEASSKEEAERNLDAIEQMLLGEREADELTQAYVKLSLHKGAGLGPARDLIRGVRSDLSQVRVRSDQELAQYCYRVAGTVGLMMCGVLGVRDAHARQHAIQLGMAMQLTNISRDVLEDARMDRVYLPEPRLIAQGIDQQQLASARLMSNPSEPRLQAAVSHVVCQLLLAAEVTYEAAAQGFRFIPARPRLAIMVASALYRAIGHRLIQTQDANPLRGRTVVPAWKKFLILGHVSVRWLGTLFHRRKVESALPHLLAASSEWPAPRRTSA